MSKVQYDFDAKGAEKVEKAFKGIASAAESSSRSTSSAIDKQIAALKRLEEQSKQTAKTVREARRASSTRATGMTDLPGVLGRLTGSSTLTGLQGALKGGSDLGSAFGITGGAAMAAGVAVAGLAAGLMVMAGVISKITSEIIIPATREAIKLSEQATGIAIHNRKAGEDMADVNGMVAESRSLAIEHPGLKTNELLEAKDQLSVDFGQQVASQLMPTIALLASSTGELPKDIATFASVLKNKAGISDPANVAALLLNSAGQMKGTHMSFGGMSGVLDKVVGRNSVLGTGPMAVAQVMGLSSMAKSQNPAEFAEGLSGVILKLKEHETELSSGKLGKSVHLSDTVGSIADVITAAKGNYGKIKEMAGKNVDPLIPFVEIAQKRADELKKAGATEDSAWATANSELRAAMTASTTTAYEESEAKQDASAREQTASAKIEGAWQKVVAASGPLADKIAAMADNADDFIPVITDLLDALTDLASWVKDTVGGWAEANHGKEHEERYQKRRNELLGDLAKVDDDQMKSGSSNPAFDKRRERINKQLAGLDSRRAEQVKSGEEWKSGNPDYLAAELGDKTHDWLFGPESPSGGGTGGAPPTSFPVPTSNGAGGGSAGSAPDYSEAAAQAEELKNAMKSCQEQTQSAADSLGEFCDAMKNLPNNR